MEIEGNLIARELKRELLERVQRADKKLSLGIIVVRETPAIRQFVEVKRRFGTDVHVNVEVLQLGQLEQNDEKLLQLLLHSTRSYDGLILQLPIPASFNLDNALSLYPLSHDVDVLGNTAFQQFKEKTLPFLPPVVGAIKEVLERNGQRLTGKKVLVVGEGRLVGAPAGIWAEREGAYVTTANKATENLSELTLDAEVIILGTGNPGLLTPDMIQDDVIIFDAGSGGTAGAIQGDADPSCATKASLFTPTPGGLGPITVAKVFENLLELHDIKSRRQ
jgi:methylenetetrahydrofolate dehydrogenase (NADP+)/methenyltetrahydrofolate cyclohydrolase